MFDFPLPSCPPRPDLNLPPMTNTTEYETRFCQALRQDRWDAALQQPAIRAIVTSPLQVVSSAEELQAMQLQPNAVMRCLNGAGNGLADFIPVGGKMIFPLAMTSLGCVSIGMMGMALVPVVGFGVAMLGAMIYSAIQGFNDKRDDPFLGSRTEMELREMEEEIALVEPPVLEHMLEQLTASESAFRTESLRPIYERTVNELRTTLRRLERADRQAAQMAFRMNRAI